MRIALDLGQSIEMSFHAESILEEHGFMIALEILSHGRSGKSASENETSACHEMSSSGYAIRNTSADDPNRPAKWRKVPWFGLACLQCSVLAPSSCGVCFLIKRRRRTGRWRGIRISRSLPKRKLTFPGSPPGPMKDGVAHVQPPSALLERMLTVRLHSG